MSTFGQSGRSAYTSHSSYDGALYFLERPIPVIPAQAGIYEKQLPKELLFMFV